VDSEENRHQNTEAFRIVSLNPDDELKYAACLIKSTSCTGLCRRHILAVIHLNPHFIETSTSFDYLPWIRNQGAVGSRSAVPFVTGHVSNCRNLVVREDDLSQNERCHKAKNITAKV
jgi:hypothetical protein